jgi:alpha-beta hydrolase superfamily lysophospholipase
MRESVCVFGESGSLVGILTDPPGDNHADDLPAILLLNAGIIHRIGPNRLYVKIARSLASSGFVVFRFDFSGIGDSALRRDNLPFEESAVREAQAAMEHLSVTRGRTRFVLLGISSGAVASYKTACRDARVAGAILVNPQNYGAELRAYAKARRYWKTALSDPRRWTRALTGRAKYRLVGPRLKSLLSARRPARSVASHIAADFHSLIARGVDLRLLYTRGDLGVDCLDVILGGELRELGARGKLKVDMIEAGDHTCTELESQHALLDLVQASVRAIAHG